MIHWGLVPVGAVLPFLFATYAGSTGASVTASGLAVTDIEVFKGTSMTQRSSDAGYTLLDTDGLDIDSMTGIQGFSIDTGDNTDASFYAAGSFYTVVVHSLTIDSQTVSAVIGTFRLGPAESSAGVPKVDTSHVAGTAQTAGDLKASLNTIDDFVDTEIASLVTDMATVLSRLSAARAGYLDNLNIGGNVASASAVDAVDNFVDTEIASIISALTDIQARIPAALTAGGNIKADALAIDGNTTAATNLQRGARGMVPFTVGTGSTTTVIETGLTEATDDHYNGGVVVFITGALAGQRTDITDYAGGTKRLTVTALTEAPANGDLAVIV